MILFPIHNLKFANDIHHELKIDEYILISPKRLRRKWKYFGLPKTYNEIHNKFLPPNSPSIFDDNSIILMMDITQKDFKSKNYFNYYDKVNSVIYILMSSQLAINSLYSRDNIGDITKYTKLFDAGFSYSGNDFYIYNPVINARDYFWLDRHILKTRRLHFFNKVIPLFNGKYDIEKEWAKDLKQAVILAGKAVSAKEHWESFNWCFVALERLLKEKSKEYFLDQISPRLNAFFGEYCYHNSGKWGELIGHIYKKRNCLFHRGEFEKIGLEDSIVTEHILKNILDLILKNLKTFNSKESVIEFAEIYKAKKVLKQPFRRKGNFSYSIPIIRDSIERIKKHRNWY